MDSFELQQGDCRVLMAAMEPESVDAIVTDPPYGLAFMGKEWDHGVPGVPFWSEALRIAKPGAHLLAFGGTRTFHRLACAIEDAGWEVRDCLSWLYGAGFPKSLDVSRALDRAAGAEREVVGHRTYAGGHVQNSSAEYLAPPIGTFVRAQDRRDVSAPSTDAAKQWAGFGTALKPAWEPIILARKPLAGTVAQNVLAHGTGALNVDGCRIGTAEDCKRTPSPNGGSNTYAQDEYTKGMLRGGNGSPLGRWPANLVLDEESARALDEQSGDRTSTRANGNPNEPWRSNGWTGAGVGHDFRDSGGASRFFYTAKASAGERHYAGRNVHPTVKPVSLMRWLVRLVTPPGGLVLDPFMGSGSTGIAALSEGMRFLGMEVEVESFEVARRRIAGPLFAGQGERLK